MGFPIGKVLSIATRALGAIVTGVPAVQAFTQTLGVGNGAAKRASVLELVQAELKAAELFAGVDLANDTDVLDAAGKVNDAVVAFHKLIGRKAAAAGIAP